MAAAPPAYVPTPELDRALASISPDALRGDVFFLASELLEGRDTPSRGLDVAAEYIAAQFHCAGLQPAGDDGYFQTAHMLRVVPPGEGFALSIDRGGRVVTLAKDQVAVVSRHSVDLARVPVYKARTPADLPSHGMQGQVMALQAASRNAMRALARAAAPRQPAAFLIPDEKGDLLPPRLVDPEQDAFAGIPWMVVRDVDAVKMLRAAKPGQTALTVTIKLPAPSPPVTVRNVIGLLRGSDPVLQEEYVLLSAHYDHLGVEGPGRIFYGANDDGSGTASVMEIARALAGAAVRPRRSIAFLTFFGEEEGNLGSRYYANHPVFPLNKTVADLNLEQLGRTDSSVGPEVSNASLTGFEYSNVARTLQQAGKLTGVKVYETPHSDQFFDRSDNRTFAEHGIPAHTIVVAFEFPDYHAVGDVWQKIDYDNMAKVDRMIALGAVMLADRFAQPRWSRANPRAARYLHAQ